MITMILSSTLMTISSPSWMTIWIMMEVNCICMCSLMSKETKKENMNPSMISTYLIIQVMSSIMFLMSSTTMNSQPLMETMFTLTMLMKMGMWPFHLWYMNILQPLKMKMKSTMMIMTWQKIIPIFMITFMTQNILLMSSITMSLITPMKKLKKSSSIKNTLILSSINNNSWFLCSALSSLTNLISFFTIYSASLMNTMMMFPEKSNQQKKPFWQILISISNMSGIPPLGFFLGKILVVTHMIKSNFPQEIILTMMLCSCILIYFYMWPSWNMMSIKEAKTSLPKNKQNPFKPPMLLLLTLCSPLILLMIP